MTKASEGIGDGGLALMRALANDRRKLVEWWKDYTGETVNKDSQPASKRRRGDDHDDGLPPVQNDPNTNRFPEDPGFPGTPPGRDDPGAPGDGGRNDPGGTTFPVDPPNGGTTTRVDPPTGGGRTRVDPTDGGETTRTDPKTGGVVNVAGDPPADTMTGGQRPRGNDPMTGGTTTVASGGRVDPMTGGGMRISGLKSVSPTRDPITRGAVLPTGVMSKPKALEWLSARGDESSFALKQALSGKAA